MRKFGRLAHHIMRYPIKVGSEPDRRRRAFTSSPKLLPPSPIDVAIITTAHK
ncbi:hypothetical protein F442_00884 [Phytophthora nicotianae P10297]|uniref:Uncharacterized protein n=2 Tax=Phytophthora nicotianae TaxID=4792 RepID=W2RGF9_PHYN3|nr:hypothetical protein PPTG_20795 [Phytophthora nicotianae INRA-310]ETN24487.1 hypothetical protein PPTG_20795 [Phytophthora nicotianae INRA-310]ETP54371.1 hypothetical protein F442_00884 [Phytophthora nicotianae P10297]